MPLHTDYRPLNLEELFGNHTTKESLKACLAREDKPHAFLLTGYSGTGKTTLGKIIKTMLNCSDRDYKEYNNANTRGIDTVREIIQYSKLSPINGNVKVYLMDESHQLSGAAGEALLKLLENPPKHAFFILCTTNPEKLLPTIRNRCTTFNLETLSNRDMLGLLDWVLSCESKTLSDQVKKRLVEVADGCPRWLLVSLDQVIDLEDEELILNTLKNNIFSDDLTVKMICQTILGKQTAQQKWKEVGPSLKAFNGDVESLRRGILAYLSAVLINGGDKKVGLQMSCFLENFYNSGKPGLILAVYSAIFEG